MSARVNEFKNTILNDSYLLEWKLEQFNKERDPKPSLSQKKHKNSSKGRQVELEIYVADLYPHWLVTPAICICICGCNSAHKTTRGNSQGAHISPLFPLLPLLEKKSDCSLHLLLFLYTTCSYVVSMNTYKPDS